ncbi:NHLP bacteriocin export ABC transporter permease/ATPase subunit [Methanospirillum hungatei]|uniref:NHLP bacteriocin export ABC transporter permease/ATPase subunit n=1 Tax=Methanospirillum hungatei TaxID=2203 RepID=UPI0026ECDC4B|nr:NHLP bacteriocin export ABC transporter permease/ATPase subunit [Methanospirillum hungatei]MCA1916237.1 NHLP bacteriocin export ABC transporter permease/ATPase subunit [Methanospirillum hungatei]
MPGTPPSPSQYLLKQGEEIIFLKRDVCYRLIEGTLILHIAEYVNGVVGRRLHGIVADKGQPIFGWEPETICLIGISQTASIIEEIEIASVKNEMEICSLWVAWYTYAQKNIPSYIQREFSKEDLYEIEYGDTAFSSGVTIHCNLVQDKFAFCLIKEGILKDMRSDMLFQAELGWFIITEHTVLETQSDGSLRITKGDKIPADFSIKLFHTNLSAWLYSRALALWNDYVYEEKKRLEMWYKQEEALNNQIQKNKYDSLEWEEKNFNIFSIILKNLGIETKIEKSNDFFKKNEKDQDLYEYVSDLADQCGVRIRRVTLSESWYTHDNGPLIVSDDNNLYAAIPEKPGKYRLYDDQGRVFNHHTIKKIHFNSSGIMVYPTFPDRSLSLYDIIHFILSLLWKRDILNLIVFGLLLGILGTSIPLATGLIFSIGIPFQNISIVETIIFIVFMSIFTSLFFQFGREIANIRIDGRIGSLFEAAIWDRILKLSPGFFRRYNAGNLTSRVGVIDDIRMVLSAVTVSMVLGGVFSLFNVIIMYQIYPDIAGYAIMLVIGVFMLTIFIGYLSVLKRKELIFLQGHLSGKTFQILSGLISISSYGAQNRAFVLWERDLKKQIALRLKIGTYDVYSKILTILWPGLLTILVFYLAGIQLSVVQPDRDQGWFLAFYSALGSFSTSFVSLGSSCIALWNIKPMMEFVSPILKTPPETDEGKEDPGILTGSVEMRHVSYRYESDAPLVLDDVTIKIQPGEFVAIVGTSGSGKSTLLRILLGFEKPDSGEVIYNGKLLSKLSIRKVRRQIGVVLQDGQLMPGSIFQNISGPRKISLEEAWKLAEDVGVDTDIREMPMQMDTYISERSANISGGQKQRILIARALAKKPQILYLDEATSALDNNSQMIVMKSLEKLHLTRVVIAHRLSTIIHADSIYVLDKGKIVEKGTYQELLDKGGIFAELARHQLL